jgi:ABC-type transport system involved in multi-copper enzyme maturation permease subunit
MILIFIIASVFIGLISLFPIIIVGMMAGQKITGPEGAEMYFGLAQFLGSIAGLLLGVTLWRQDQKDGTILTFLARPLSRIELLIGKIVGCTYALAVFTGTVVALYLCIHLIFFSFALPLVSSLYLLQFMAFLLAMFAIGAFCSSLAGSLGAAVMACGYLVLRAIGDILLNSSPAWAQFVGKVIRFLSISFSIPYGLGELLTADTGSVLPMLEAIGYYLLWAVMLLSASIIVFSKREFTGRRS